MKNLYKWAILALAGLLVCGVCVACDDDDDADDDDNTIYTLKVSPASITMTSAGGSSTVTVTSDTGWTVATSDASWVSLSEASGSGDGSFTVTVAANSETSARTATVTVSTANGRLNSDVTISQAATGEDENVSGDGESGDEYISVSPSTLTFDAAGGSYATTITTDGSWSIYSLDAADDSWVTFSTTNGTGNAEIIVYVAENTTAYARSISYVVEGNVSQASLSITQAASSGTTSSTVTVEIDSEIKVAAEGSGYYSEDDEDYAGEPILTFCVYTEGSTTIPTVTSDNDNFKPEYISSSNPSEKTGTEYWFGLIVGATTSESATTCILTVTVDDYVGYITVIQASVSGSYAAEGEEIVFVSNDEFLTMMGTTRISNLYTTYGSNPITLYSDSGINMTLNSEENCEWYYFQLSSSSSPSYYFRFNEGGQFTISSTAGVTFSTIELLVTDEISSSTLTSNVGTMSAGSAENFEIGTTTVMYYPIKWTGSATSVTFTATSRTNVRAMRFTYTE